MRKQQTSTNRLKANGRRLRALASILVVAIGFSTAMATVTGVKWNKKWDANTKTLTTVESGDNAADWMADLPDNMFVAQVSIPGAHDFATGELSILGSASSVCQNATMDELLEGGIRAIDFRPGCDRSISGWSGWTPQYTYYLNLCHGTTDIGISFLAGMQKLATYLENHQQEFFVIHIFPGNDNQKSSSILGFAGETAKTEAARLYQEALSDASVSPYIVQYDPNITVGEARGKILIAVRPKASYLANDKQADIVNWVTTFSSNQRPSQLTLHGKTAGSTADGNVSARLHVQDISSPSDDGTVNLETKKVHMVNLLEYAQERRVPNEMYALNGYYTPEWFMNFLSMYTSTISSTDSYKENATTMNALLLEKLNGTDGTAGSLGAGPLGIIMMDYCLNTETNGDQAVYKVIENNFTGGDQAPVVRFAIDETKNWKEYPKNPWAGKKFFLRNMGAGEDEQAYCYLGGGGPWGACAVANYSGHFFQIEDGDTAHRLASVFGHLQNKDNDYWCDPVDGDNNYGTEFLVDRAYWDGNPVWYITCQVCSQRLTAVPYITKDANGNETGTNPYYDRPQFDVAPTPNEENNPYQMWQILPMTEDDQVEGYTIAGQSRLGRMQSLANKDRGMDATFLIPSYSFGNNDSSYTDGFTYTNGDQQKGWAVTPGANLTAGKEADGNGAMWRAYNTATEGNTFSLSTEVLNLPKGNYTLEFQYVSTADGVSCKIGDNLSTTTLAKNSDKVDGLTAGSAEIAKVGTFFNTLDAEGKMTNGLQKITFEKTSDATTALKFEFARESDVTEPASFYLDNLKLTYYGETSQPKTTIKLKYPRQWGTICLPFDAAVPEGLEVYEATGVTDNVTTLTNTTDASKTLTYQVIQLSPSPVTQINANYPYIVKHKALVDAQSGTQSATAPRRATAEELAAKDYVFEGYPTNRKNDYHDVNGVLTGLIEERALNNSTDIYALTYGELTDYTGSADEVQYFDQTYDDGDGSNNVTVLANRAYVNARTDSTYPTANIVTFEEQYLVGVGRVTLDANEPVDVFDVTGICLRSGVKRSEALQGLSSGVYLLKGRSGITKVIHD